MIVHSNSCLLLHYTTLYPSPLFSLPFLPRRELFSLSFSFPQYSSPSSASSCCSGSFLRHCTDDWCTNYTNTHSIVSASVHREGKEEEEED